MTKVTLSMVNNRFRCAIFIRQIAIDKDFGVITNVQLKRISFMVWHIQFDSEVKN